MILHFLLFFSVLLVSTYAYYKYALKTKILDNPNDRSSHTIPTVRGGGIVFFIAVLLYFIWQQKMEYPYFLTGFLILSIIGFIDDKKELSARVRFPFQLIAVAFILYEAGLFTMDISIIVKIVAFIAGVSFINAFNFMDGINGITGFYTLVVLIPLYYINKEYLLFPEALFMILMIAILVFGIFNFRKNALMFAGDIGSMSLAAILLFLLSKYMLQLQAPILIGLLIVYGIDSAMTILYRAIKRENVFQAHRWHLYQKLVDVWQWSHLQVALLYALVQLFISFFIISKINTGLISQLLLIVLLLIFLGVLYIYLQYYFKARQEEK